MTDEQIARVVHEANRALQFIYGDEHPSQPWDAETEHVRRSIINGVRNARKPRLKGVITAEESHENWMRFQKAAGWTHGEQKDVTRKTHPNLVDYDKLPDCEKTKDKLFLAIVGTLSRDSA